jgi:poly(3-hydroxybutyrate) depolymerase
VILRRRKPPSFTPSLVLRFLRGKVNGAEHRAHPERPRDDDIMNAPPTSASRPPAPRSICARAAGWLLRLLLLSAAGAAHAAAPLPRLGVDLSQASVSGLSSGGYMAVQMHVAYSATFAKGAGIVAGGPFHCAEGSVFNAAGRCMAHSAPIPVAALVATTQAWARSGDIDPLSHLAASKVYLYAGSADRTVRPAVLKDLLDYYRRFVPAGRIAVRSDVASDHAMITDDFGGDCSASEPPFIDNCGFDLAGAILGHLYGPLKARNASVPHGSLAEFDQTPFVRGHGMAATGWVYVPRACAAASGPRCRLHVAFHGCKQSSAYVGEQYVRHAGYNRWADGNDIVVLYPQTGGAAINGCWDWWGYDSADYAKKRGPQMAAVKAMVDALASTGRLAEPARGAAAGDLPPAATCHTDTNYGHTVAGRAHASLGLAFANGSNQNMGWWNVFVTTTLKQTAPGYYVVGTCP